MRLLRLLLPVFVLCCLPFVAARAGSDPYSVSGIVVDASASSATQAQTIAINSGRARAWTTLYRRLAKQEDWSRQPTLDDTTLQRLVRSYLVSNERRSTTRFVASMTYVFNAGAVRRILHQADIAYTDTEARTLLVVPMGPGYAPHSPWAMAWADQKYAHGSVPLVAPQGDAEDVSALGSLSFGGATWQDVQPSAARVHAQEAYLVLAQPSSGQVVVKIRHLGTGSSPTIPDITVPTPAKTPSHTAWGLVADATASAVVDSWKGRNLIDYNKRSKLVADVRVDSLESWSQMLQRLSAVPTVTEVGVVAMDIGEARISINYVGSSDQLKDNLAHANLDLLNAGGEWSLSTHAASSDMGNP
jgi:hypothetical protein